MKKHLSLLTSVLILVSASSAYAFGPYGPPEPTAQPGKLSMSLGYYYSYSTWDLNGSENDDGSRPYDSSRQRSNMVYIQGSYSFAKNWEVYARLGGADLQMNDNELPRTFNDGFAPYGSVGIKGLIYKDSIFGLGPFMQASMGSSYKRDFTGVDEDGEPYNLSVRVQNPWDISAGIAGQAKLGPATIYGGPFVYIARNTWRVTGSFNEFDDEVGSDTFRTEERNHVGGFFGVRVPVTNKVSFDIEGVLRSEISMGAAVNFAFGQ